MQPYYHGGKAGLQVGDTVCVAPPHVEDGCPICIARAQGRTFTVGEYRLWLLAQGDDVNARRLLNMLEGADPASPMDPPSGKPGVYVTTDRLYATFYASKARGDLYRVEPTRPLQPSTEDHFPTWVTSYATVVEVLQRHVTLSRKERRELLRRWKKADRDYGRHVLGLPPR
jgi:hypothetical protein